MIPPFFPVWAFPQVGNVSDVLSDVLDFSQRLFRGRAGGLTVSRRRPQGQSPARAGPVTWLRPSEGEPRAAAVDKTGVRGFVVAGPRRRSGTARSWCRSPARQAARQRSSKGAPPASPGTLWAFRQGSGLPGVGWMGRAGEGLSGSRGRVAGGQLYRVLGTLGTVRFFVGEKSPQSEHPGDPGQGAQPTLPGGLHPSPESPREG